MLKLYCWTITRMHALRETNERGAAAVEYGLLVALIALAVVVAIYWVGQKTNGVFCQIVSELPFGPTDCAAPMP
ncbi:MAG: Flp family type IVb pilin [Actinomycetota bacterium]